MTAVILAHPLFFHIVKWMEEHPALTQVIYELKCSENMTSSPLLPGVIMKGDEISMKVRRGGPCYLWLLHHLSSVMTLTCGLAG